MKEFDNIIIGFERAENIGRGARLQKVRETALIERSDKMCMAVPASS